MSIDCEVYLIFIKMLVKLTLFFFIMDYLTSVVLFFLLDFLGRCYSVEKHCHPWLTPLPAGSTFSVCVCECEWSSNQIVCMLAQSSLGTVSLSLHTHTQCPRLFCCSSWPAHTNSTPSLGPKSHWHPMVWTLSTPCEVVFYLSGDVAKRRPDQIRQTDKTLIIPHYLTNVISTQMCLSSNSLQQHMHVSEDGSQMVETELREQCEP